MFKFIGRALAGLVLTKDAQKAVGQIHLGGNPGKAKTKSPFAQQPGGPSGVRNPADAAKAEAMADAQSKGSEIVTADRAELIRQAMRVRSAKQAILADLDDETRGKLVATAMKALLKQDREKP